MHRLKMTIVVIWYKSKINEFLFTFLHYLLHLNFLFIGLQEHIHYHHLFLQSLSLFYLFFFSFTPIPSQGNHGYCVVKCVLLLWLCIFNYINGIVIFLSFHFYFLSVRTILWSIYNVMCKFCILFLIAS